MKRGYSQGDSPPTHSERDEDEDSASGHVGAEKITSTRAHVKLLCHLDGIREWQLACAMQASVLDWTCITPSSLRARDNQRQAGAFHFNNDARNTDFVFSGAATRFLALRDEYITRNTELDRRSHIAQAIADIWSCDALPAQRSVM